MFTRTTKEWKKQWEQDNIDLNNYFEDSEMYLPNVGVFDEHQFSVRRIKKKRNNLIKPPNCEHLNHQTTKL
ncbi:hypothetical protein MTR_4g102085 [Medicago truncatula]|uniref:Uncharacterized protein n=1 Tax=Medicago truncatula TaxID=3880 RepID=A0A072V0K4_MEDTR|nr:hypothetical protein MTR_4g102085 [Medicago truncatula]